MFNECMPESYKCIVLQVNDIIMLNMKLISDILLMKQHVSNDFFLGCILNFNYVSMSVIAIYCYYHYRFLT